MEWPFARRRRAAIEAPIKARFAFDLRDGLAGKFLNRPDFAAQRLFARGLDQRSDEIVRWLAETCPQNRRRPQAEGAVICRGGDTAADATLNVIRPGEGVVAPRLSTTAIRRASPARVPAHPSANPSIQPEPEARVVSDHIAFRQPGFLVKMTTTTVGSSGGAAGPRSTSATSAWKVPR